MTELRAKNIRQTHNGATGLKSKVVYFRISGSDYLRLQQLASIADCNVSDIARSAVNKRLREPAACSDLPFAEQLQALSSQFAALEEQFRRWLGLLNEISHNRSGSEHVDDQRDKTTDRGERV